MWPDFWVTDIEFNLQMLLPAGKGFPVLMTSKIHHHVYKSQPLDPIWASLLSSYYVAFLVRFEVFTSVKIWVVVFWVMTRPSDESGKFLRNVGNHVHWTLYSSRENLWTRLTFVIPLDCYAWGREVVHLWAGMHLYLQQTQTAFSSSVVSSYLFILQTERKIFRDLRNT